MINHGYAKAWTHLSPCAYGRLLVSIKIIKLTFTMVAFLIGYPEFPFLDIDIPLLW